MPRTVSVVIATYRRPDHLQRCLTSLDAQTVVPARIVVVDSSPDDRSHAVVAAHPRAEYRSNPLGRGHTATSRRIGVEDLTEDVVAFLDDDARADPDWLRELLAAYDGGADIAAVGGRARNGQPDEESEGIGEIGLLLPDGRLTGFFAADPGRTVDVDHMLGANMSIDLSALRGIGGIRDFYPGTCLREETDAALRLRRVGRRIVYAPRAVVDHDAGEYAKGKRFDLRYRYYGARNHVVLLTTTLGWRDPHVRRYARTAARGAIRGVRGGIHLCRTRPSVAGKVRGLGGAVVRAAVDLIGFASGVVTSVGLLVRGKASP